MQILAQKAVSSGDISNKCPLSQKIQHRDICFPQARCMSESAIEKVPYVFFGDGASALTSYLMKPCSKANLTVDKRRYSYRRSHARQISENMLGIIANCWHLFHTVTNLSPEKICLITRATITLHNVLWKGKSRKIYSLATLIDSDGEDNALNPLHDGVLRQKNVPCNNLISVQCQQKGCNPCRQSKRLRNCLKTTFVMKVLSTGSGIDVEH